MIFRILHGFILCFLNLKFNPYYDAFFHGLELNLIVGLKILV